MQSILKCSLNGEIPVFSKPKVEKKVYVIAQSHGWIHKCKTCQELITLKRLTLLKILGIPICDYECSECALGVKVVNPVIHTCYLCKKQLPDWRVSTLEIIKKPRHLYSCVDCARYESYESNAA